MLRLPLIPENWPVYFSYTNISVPSSIDNPRLENLEPQVHIPQLHGRPTFLDISIFHLPVPLPQLTPHISPHLPALVPFSLLIMEPDPPAYHLLPLLLKYEGFFLLREFSLQTLADMVKPSQKMTMILVYQLYLEI